MTFNKGEYVLRLRRDNSVESILTCLNMYASKKLGSDIEIENPFGLQSTARGETSVINGNIRTQAALLLLLLFQSCVAVYYVG